MEENKQLRRIGPCTGLHSAAGPSKFRGNVPDVSQLGHCGDTNLAQRPNPDSESLGKEPNMRKNVIEREQKDELEAEGALVSKRDVADAGKSRAAER